ncbi:MAG: hypothetical protein WEB00_08850 [Dehalococcoidia bacterium]
MTSRVRASQTISLGLAGLALVGLALLMQHTGASAAGERSTEYVGQRPSGAVPTGTYLHVSSGMGTGTGNTRNMTFSCDPGDELLSGGFSSIDQGTHVAGNRPVSKRTWRLTWINDATVDSVSVWIFCGDGIAPGSYSLETSTGFSDYFGTNCPTNGSEGVVVGGWYGIRKTNFVERSAPTDIQSWFVRTSDFGDDHSVQSICLDFDSNDGGPANTGVGVPGNANQDSTLETSCSNPATEVAAGGGFAGLAPGSHLREARPSSGDTFKITWHNDATVDTVTVHIDCMAP